MDYVQAKWGKTEEAKEKRNQILQKRQIIGLSDYGQDNFYFAQVSVGTPKQNFDVILDTGSADFWLVDTDCTSSQCDGSALFNPSASSTYHASSNPFQITYGTGAVKGTLSADTVSLAGYTVDNQTFAVATQLAPQSLQAPTSGIMGMGFQALAQSRATPFWEVLVQQNKLKTNAFTFQLARNSRTATSNSQISPGGVFTLGEIDQSQYSGNINYVDLSNQEGYWTVPLQALSVDGQNGNINGDGTSAIDTGTTLIIAPPSVAEQIYEQVPGANPVSSGFGSSSQGMYSIPCSSSVNISLTFGGQQYSINPADMNAGALDSSGQNCLGGILGSDLGSGAPNFIVGDVFLKNVFSVYQYSPAAVGFAALKGQAAQTASTTSGAVKIGSNTAAAASASSSSGGSGGGLPPLFSSILSGSGSGSSLAAGSGLPSPSAAASVSASSPSLTPANGADSNNSGSLQSSGTKTIVTNQVVGLMTMFFALICGMAIAF
ncbi:Asp-domain-containing protein [Meira miltonrushii]|uniref:Asp-domain-containing protein n=1 Tax=Meira miltonrushii TaxID=1280837 RepID=A0A316VIR5_9BASI|nr:Asp-domain-containing protein [Meira miltonrushii]PWN37492.1 Asp-domain-containing protein [Meira miltonrushii]